MKIRKLYTPPQCEIFVLRTIDVMCQSPGNGGVLGDEEYEPLYP